MLQTSVGRHWNIVLKHVSNNKSSYGSIALTLLWSLFFICLACSPSHRSEEERLNDMAYAYHYRSLDSVKIFSERVLERKPDGDAMHEAYNNLAFYHIGKMQYNVADSILQLILDNSNNHIELAIANIQKMRLCQRKSENKEFYTYRQKAINHLKRLKEEKGYSAREKKRIGYAECEIRLITSVYDYYVGRTEEAKIQLHEMDSINVLLRDTVQTEAYLYNIGAGGILTKGTRDIISHMEYDLLLQCYMTAEENGDIFWKANSMQAIAEHILDDGGEYIHENNIITLYMNTEDVPDSLLAGNITLRALQIFTEYGDVYQQAAAWRTLSRCYGRLKDYHGMIYALRKAETVSPLLSQAPALMASIYELYSIAFSAIDNKQESDFYRNKYLDLYDDTRQDRQLEARAELLDKKIHNLNILIFVILTIVLLMVILLIYLVVRRNRRQREGKTNVSQTIKRICRENTNTITDLDNKIEEKEEQCKMVTLQKEKQQEYFIEQRAKAHLILTITPLLDRMYDEIRRMDNLTEYRGNEVKSTDNNDNRDYSENLKEEDATIEKRSEYIRELLLRINDENAFLTRWIQMKQGELSLHIETFPLQNLLEIVRKGASTYSSKGITLVINDTDVCIKADKILTLFMINTLCDNARKFTPEGGTVTVSARDIIVGEENMVEIDIEDTGTGMSEEQQAKIFEVKAIADEALHAEIGNVTSRSHGFGLSNCKGIIEKYKKTNALFRHCEIGVKSKEGKGTKVFFTLPKGVRQVLAILLMVFFSMTAKGNIVSMADSVYHCNVTGRYEKALEYAEKCFHEINMIHLSENTAEGGDSLQMLNTSSIEYTEVKWLHKGVAAPYDIILSLRNEVAVAALALHRWQLYHYNNDAYSQLFKDYSADKTLSEYCRKMEKTESDSNVAIMILLALILSMIPIYYFTYYKHVIEDSMAILKVMQEKIAEKESKLTELSERNDRLTFEHDRLHIANNIMSNSLSTIKHETMYYPSRIQQLLDNGDIRQMREVAEFYSLIYHALSLQTQHNSRNILPAKTIMAILKRQMAKIAGVRVSELVEEVSGPYSTFHVVIPHEKRGNEKTEITLRIIKQAARDLGEIYALRRCGMTVTGENVEIVVPSHHS